MKLNTVGVVALLGGVVLLYAAVKNIKPQDVIRMALGKPAIGGPIATPTVGAVQPPATATLPPATGVTVVTT